MQRASADIYGLGCSWRQGLGSVAHRPTWRQACVGKLASRQGIDARGLQLLGGVQGNIVSCG